MLVTLGSVLVSLVAAVVYITDLVKNPEIPCVKSQGYGMCEDPYYVNVSLPP